MGQPSQNAYSDWAQVYDAQGLYGNRGAPSTSNVNFSATSKGVGSSNGEANGALQGLQSLTTPPPAAAPAPMGGGPAMDAVAAPSLTGTAVDVAAPTAPTGAPTSMPPDLAGGQTLSGPTAGRQGIGQRVPPSLAALLKVRAY